MTEVRAADLPEGSIVASRHHVYLKQGPGAWSTNFGNYPTGDWAVEDSIVHGARVLRHGYGEES